MDGWKVGVEAGSKKCVRIAYRPLEAAINLKQTRYFIKAVEIGSMTGAAQELRIAQPALGVQIRALEYELKQPLIERHSRGVVPTAAGQILAQRGRRILADTEDLAREIMLMSSGTAKRIGLGVSPKIALVVGDVLFEMAGQIMPSTSLSLVEERSPGLFDALRKQQVDVALIFGAAHEPGFVRTTLLEKDLMLLTASSNAPKSADVTLKQALSYDLVMSGARGILRNVIAEEAAKFSVDCKLAWKAHSISATKAMVLSGKAASIMPYSLAVKEIEAGQLVATKISRPGLTRILYLVSRETIAIDDSFWLYVDSLINVYLSHTTPWSRLTRIGR